MKKLSGILKHVNNYKAFAGINVFFNLLSTVFSLFSLTMIVPFLDLIFMSGEEQYSKYLIGEPSEFSLSVESIKNYFYSQMAGIIVNPEKGKMYALVVVCAVVFLNIMLKNLFRYLAMYYMAPLRNGVVRDMRNKIYEKALALSLSYHSEERKGDLIARMTSDIQEIEWTIMTSLEMLFKDPVTIAALFCTLLVMSPELTLFVLVMLPLTGYIIGRIGKSLKKTSTAAQEKMGLLVASIDEMLTGLRIIKAFNAENITKRRFQIINEHYKKIMIKMYRKRDLSSPLSEFLGVTVLLFIIWFGGRLVLEGNGLSASVFIAYIAIFSQLIPPAKSFTTAYYHLQKGAASLDRVNEILDADIIIKDEKEAKPISVFSSSIEYRKVSFAYRKVGREETPPPLVLNNVSLFIPKGKMFAIVGQSGAGKTTFVDLLPRFYDPVEGELLIDEIPVRSLKIRDLRNLMGFVTQESILFNDTVFNNIALGMGNVKSEDVVNAAKIANADDFIRLMENGYDTIIGDRGGKLSGGQRQRVAIARAILKNPSILILDEATSALDTESEKLVQDALNNLMKNRTSIVIAHRLSTIQNADEIIVLDKGEIAERGTHSDLFNRQGIYRKLCDLQMFK